MPQSRQKNNSSRPDKQEKSFRKTTNRFFEPVRKTPWLSLGRVFLVFTKAIGKLGGAYIVSKIVFGLENSDREMFLDNLHIYISDY